MQAYNAFLRNRFCDAGSLRQQSDVLTEGGGYLRGHRAWRRIIALKLSLKYFIVQLSATLGYTFGRADSLCRQLS